MYTVNPKNKECYFLRLLLNNKIGPTSFENLKTVDNIVYETYREACLQLGLIGDDHEWVYAMQEAELCESSFKMRNLFTVIIAFCEINDPKDLWCKFWTSMGDDFRYKIINSNVIDQKDIEKFVYGLTYNEINKTLFNTSGKLLSDFKIEKPSKDITVEQLSILLQETSYNCIEEKIFFDQHINILNSDQEKIFLRIMEKLNNNEHGIIFIDAPGGTGKTYVLNVILAKVRSESKIALAVASSGKLINKINCSKI